MARKISKKTETFFKNAENVGIKTGPLISRYGVRFTLKLLKSIRRTAETFEGDKKE